MIQVQFLPERNVLCVTGIPTPFPAGSLEARQSGDMLAVASPHEDYLITQWTRYDRWIRGDGSGFLSVEEAFDYLDRTCRQKRPVGDRFSIPVVVAYRGQRTLPLEITPTNYASIRVVVNGVEYRVPDIVITGTSILWSVSDFELSPEDRISVIYS